ncbi:MAG: SCO family protein [Pseudomonadota bacterium]
MPTRLLIIAAATVLILGGALGVTLISKGTTEAGGKALIGGPFALVDQTGKAVTEKDFEGSFMIAYFGYTFCPDFCPLGLSTITEALELLDDEEVERIKPVFFTVDPARDTVERLADYVSHFHPRLVGLTGTDEQVAAAAKAYRIYYNIPEHEGDDYPVDHSTFTYLMDPDGTYAAHFSHDVSPEELAERLKTELKKG